MRKYLWALIAVLSSIDALVGIITIFKWMANYARPPEWELSSILLAIGSCLLLEAAAYHKVLAHQNYASKKR